MLEFQSFYQENLGPVYRYVYSNVGNRQEAEDLTSKIFIKALRGLDLERDVRSVHAWLFRVARTTITDYWRARYRETTSSLDELLETGWEGPTESEPPPENGMAVDRVRGILQALPERDRDVLTYRFLMHLSVRETALKMGLTEANVKVVQYRALKHAAHLKGLLGNDDLQGLEQERKATEEACCH